MTNREIIEKFYETITQILNWAEDENFSKEDLFNELHNNIGQAKEDIINEIEK